MVLGNVSSVFAVTISVQDGPFTVNVGTSFPLSLNLPAKNTTTPSLYYSDYDMPCVTRLYFVCNDSSYWKKLSNFRFIFNINTIVGQGLFTSYPSGAQFSHSVRTDSFISERVFCSVATYYSTSNIAQVLYDCYVVPIQNESYVLDCGFSMYGNVRSTASSSGVIALVANPTLTPLNFQGFFGIYDSMHDSNILDSINGSIQSLLSYTVIDSSNLQRLVNLVMASNTLLTSINTAINNGFTGVNNNLVDINGHIVQFDKDMVAAITNQTTEIQTSITNLQTAVLKSLETINNQLILIKNGLVRLDYDLLNSFNFFLSALTGVQDNWSQLEFTVTNANRIIKNLQDNWSAIIEKGLDKVAPDTSKFDTEQEAASKQLADIGQSDLISGIADTSDADVAFNYFTSVFQGFHSKILLYNNLLQQVFNSLGNLRYVIYATMGVGLLGFFFRVGNTFIRSGSGGSSKSVSFPKKLK